MMRNAAAALAVVLVMIAVALPALAKQRVKPASGDSAMSRHRASAVRECNEKAGKLLQYTWGVTQLEVYESCMAGHGEMN